MYTSNVNTHVVFCGLSMAAVSTFKTETFTTCCAIARTTGNSTMNSNAMPSAARTAWIAIAFRVLYHPFFCQKCFG